MATAMKIDSQCVVVTSKSQCASSVGGETVILSLAAGRYYGVQAVAARVWQIIQTPTAVAEIRNALVSEYDIEPECCEADLLELLGGHARLSAKQPASFSTKTP
jgi:hypothetical protein